MNVLYQRSPLMIRRTLAAVLLSTLTGPGRAQISITGISDESVYADRVSFTIQAEPGYSYDARLDGIPVPVGSAVGVTDIDYHDLRVSRTNEVTLATDSERVQFIVRASDRGSTEVGIPRYTPFPPIPSSTAQFAGAQMRLLVPASYPQDMPIPAVVWVVNDSNQAVRVNGVVTAPGQDAFPLFRGVGSGFIRGSPGEASLAYTPAVGGVTTLRTLALESNTTWTAVSGTLSGEIDWPVDSRISIIDDLTLANGATLTIGAGSIVRVHPGVDITSEARVRINGTLDRPVVFAPLSPTQPWGGFIMPNSAGSVEGTGVLFTGSGAVPNWFGSNGNPGSHRREQALFFCGGDNTLTLTDAAAIYLAGQLGHSTTGSDITLTRFLLQRATTGGEFTGASFNVNESAFIEFPGDSPTFEDGDHDALYIMNGTHGFTNTLFGWTKDDGVDSGGDGSGLLEFRSCWFEGIYHEGNSLSGTGKIVNHRQGVFLNCGQALEAGYGGPHGLLDHCLVTQTLSGGRFGDNYDRSYTGSMSARGSLLIYNHRDVWGMNWQDWAWRTSQMSITNNWLTAPIAEHPANTVWNPASDGWRLAAYINTPPQAPVGIGLALRGSRFLLTELASEIPVGLSSFSTNEVRVSYVVDIEGARLAEGSLTFLPGQTLQMIPPLPAIPLSAKIVRVRLSHPVQGELSGLREAWFTQPPDALVPAGAQWRFLDTGMDAGTSWREPGYDDGGWSAGPAELGYGEGDEATVIGYGPSSGAKYITTYFRHRFMVPNPSAMGDLTLRLKRDDGGVVYLNGVEVFRSNMADGPVDYLTRAPEAPDDGKSWFSTTLPPTLLVAGDNLVAVEIHQTLPTSSDVSFDCELTSVPGPVIRDAWFGNDWTLYWQDEAYRLESAPAMEGPWQSLETSGPYTVEGSGTQEFFRLQKP